MTPVDFNQPHVLCYYSRFDKLFSFHKHVWNQDSNEALEALLTGFGEKESALFRHEVAFVFGQIGEAAQAAEERLIEVVEDEASVWNLGHLAPDRADLGWKSCRAGPIPKEK